MAEFGRRIDGLTLIADGAVTGGLFFTGYDPSVGAGTPGGVRFTVDALATYIGALAGTVTSVFGRTGAIVQNPGDYTALTTLAVTTLTVTTFKMVCADDASVHRVQLRLQDGQYMLEIEQAAS